MSNNYFGKLIKDNLKQKQISLRKLSKKVGLDPSFLSKVISGKRNPPSEERNLVKIAHCLDCDADTLVLSAGRIPKKYQTSKNRQKFLNLFKQLSARR
jgi:HTH-type transcriptional regulator, competence development regulator